VFGDWRGDEAMSRIDELRAEQKERGEAALHLSRDSDVALLELSMLWAAQYDVLTEALDIVEKWENVFDLAEREEVSTREAVSELARRAIEEKSELECDLEFVRKRLIDADVLHLADEQTIRNQQRVIEKLEVQLAETTFEVVCTACGNKFHFGHLLMKAQKERDAARALADQLAEEFYNVIDSDGKKTVPSSLTTWEARSWK
jgi:hypothetical protein